MKIIVLGSNETVMASKIFSGKDLENYVTHKDDSSGVWKPRYERLQLDGSSDNKAALSTWIWMKKAPSHTASALLQTERDRQAANNAQRQLLQDSNTKKQESLEKEKKAREEKEKIAEKKKKRLDRVLSKKKTSVSQRKKEKE